MAEPKEFRVPTSKEMREVEDAYALAVGRVSVAWNYLHGALGDLFALVIGGDVELVLASWSSNENDRAQREMLRVAIKTASPGRWKQTPEAPDDLLWILGRADKLSDVRNDAIHALVLLHIGLETVEMNVASPPGASANENCSTTLRRVRSSSTISPNARVMSTRSTPSLGGPLARSPSLTGGSGRPRGHRKHGKRLA